MDIRFGPVAWEKASRIPADHHSHIFPKLGIEQFKCERQVCPPRDEAARCTLIEGLAGDRDLAKKKNTGVASLKPTLQLALHGMQNRTCYLHRLPHNQFSVILIAVMLRPNTGEGPKRHADVNACVLHRMLDITETSRAYLVLVGMWTRTFGPCLKAITRIFVSIMRPHFVPSIATIVKTPNSPPSMRQELVCTSVVPTLQMSPIQSFPCCINVCAAE
jgi:hypothetical protein